VLVGKQDIKYYCEIITCIVITLINIKSSRNINCDLWSPESFIEDQLTEIGWLWSLSVFGCKSQQMI
jgi:hypothetical protein